MLNKRLEQGSPLSQEQIELILSHSDNLIKERKKGLNYIRNAYAERGKREGVDPQAFVDWFGFLPQDDEEGNGPTTATPAAHRKARRHPPTPGGSDGQQRTPGADRRAENSAGGPVG
jgi:hypothetical protein